MDSISILLRNKKKWGIPFSYIRQIQEALKSVFFKHFKVLFRKRCSFKFAMQQISTNGKNVLRKFALYQNNGLKYIFQKVYTLDSICLFTLCLLTVRSSKWLLGDNLKALFFKMTTKKDQKRIHSVTSKSKFCF